MPGAAFSRSPCQQIGSHSWKLAPYRGGGETPTPSPAPSPGGWGSSLTPFSEKEKNKTKPKTSVSLFLPFLFQSCCLRCSFSDRPSTHDQWVKMWVGMQRAEIT